MSVSKVITFEEVQKHTDKKSLWIVIHDSVYDVSAFLSEHPGGEDALLEFAGKEATAAFEEVGHSSDARELLKKYKIGELDSAVKFNYKEYIPHAILAFTIGITIGFLVKRYVF